MGNVGRIICVALPFILTLGALISLLVAALAGVAGNKDSLYMFRVNTTGLSVEPTSLIGLIGSRNVAAPVDIAAAAEIAARQTGTLPTNGFENLTAADLGLNKLYDVSLWGFCYDPQTGDRTCLQPKFNWAQTEINSTLSTIKNLANSLGRNVTIPSEISDALNLYSTVSRWTQVVFIIALVALALELILGAFTSCSRAVSCLVWIVAGVASAATMAAAALATATAVVVVGAVEASAKIYGVRASFNTNFLAAIWIAVAFALGAGFFWLFTVCCCKPDRSSSKKSRHLDDQEKFVPQGSYAPLGTPQNNAGFYNYGQQNTSYGAHQQRQSYGGSGAYEPYKQQHV